MMGALLRRELLLSVRHGADTMAALLFFVLVGGAVPARHRPGPGRVGAPGARHRLGRRLAGRAASRSTACSAPTSRMAASTNSCSAACPRSPSPPSRRPHIGWSPGLPLLLAAGPLAIMLQMPPASVPVLLLALLPGTLALSLLGTMGAAIVLGARRGGVLLPLLVAAARHPGADFRCGGGGCGRNRLDAPPAPPAPARLCSCASGAGFAWPLQVPRCETPLNSVML